MENLDQTYKRLIQENSKVDEALKGNQHKIDKNKNGKVDAHDFKLLRNKKVDEMIKDEPSAGRDIGSQTGTGKDREAKPVKARDLARSLLNKHLNKTYDAYNPDKDKLKKQHFGMAEEVESIDELSKGTLGSYVKKASRDATITRKIGADFENRADRARSPGMKDSNTELSSKYKQKSWKRRDGLEKAVDRLTKEAVDEAFINGREYASHGLMHPDHANTPLHKVTGKTIDFYAHGTGDKVQGKVVYHDQDRVHIRDTKGKKHEFKISKDLPKQTNEEVEQLDEKIYADDYHSTSETSQFGGHRPHVVSKDTGKTMFLGQHAYKTPKHAIEHAQAYLSGYAKTGMHGGDRASQAYSTANKHHLHMNEEVELDEVLKPSMGAGAYIDDFVKSKNPKFAGKSADKRKQMALAAYYAAKKGVKEEAELEESMYSSDVERAFPNGKASGVKTHAPVAPVPPKKKEQMKPRVGHPTNMKEAKDEHEYGYEGDMAMNQLATLTRCADMIKDCLKPDTDLPEWVQSKITLATDYIQTAADYLHSEMNESTQNATPTVKTNKYSWGTMKTIHHGSSFSIPLHPEHHEHIAKMKDQQVHSIKTEDGKHYHVKREGDTVHFAGANGGNKTSVPHKSLAEETQVDEAWVLRQKKKDKKTVKEESVKTFKDFLADINEVKMSDLPVRRIKGHSYGNQPEDNDDEDDEDNKPAMKKPESTEKRGRGRPAGAKSGAKQIGSAPKQKSGVDYSGYKLHLPNSNR